MNDKLIELQNLIDKANYDYYIIGNSSIEDYKYDLLKEQLKELNPEDIRLQQVGSIIRDSMLEKKKHTIPMGSLNKCMNQEEWNSWIQNNLIKAGVNKGELLHASLKMDGGSFSLYYKNGVLTEAISRGDGITGEDITANALQFKGLQPIIKNNSFTGYVRGEVVLTMDDWLMVDQEQTSNPRNLAVGIARRKDGYQASYLTFYAFRIFDENGIPISDTEGEMTDHLSYLGFATVPSLVGTIEEIWKWYGEMGNCRNKMNYWIDGVVVKLNNIDKQLKLGESSNCPKGMVAIKFEAETGITTLLNVTLQVGNSGVICPVATFEPVRLGGTTIVNASLCNYNNIEILDIAIGDKIELIKAGDIIPRIMSVIEKGKNRKTIIIPENCPVCNSKLERKENVNGLDSTAIYCVNQECPAIITGRIQRFVKSTDIQGVGVNLIEALVKDLNIKTPADLYLLHNHRDELVNLVLSGKVKFGEKRADKLLEEIEKKRNLSLSDFLGSLLIFGLGKRRVVLIQSAIPGQLDTLDDWLYTNKLIENASQCGVMNIAQRIHNEIVEQKDYILSFIKNGVIIEKPQPKLEKKEGSLLFCITGKMEHPKKYYHDLIEKSGNIWTDTFSKDINYLIAADTKSGSSKLKKAEKNGTKIISEQELMKIISV